MTITPIHLSTAKIQGRFDWNQAVDALRQGHRLARAEIGDIFLGPASGTMLNRAAYIAGFGYGMKSVTVFGDNPKAGLASVQGAMLLFEPEHGQLLATIESPIITEIKTAADSVLGAEYLARPNPRTLLIAGAGTVATSLVNAYQAAFPSLERILIWARREEAALAFAQNHDKVEAAPDLAAACAQADIISTATMAREPILKGAWIAPGTHVDLIGAFKADMREADDELIATARVFVDSFDTTIDHIGELKIPIEAGVITRASVLGDFYDLEAGRVAARQSDDDITVFKNGGGAHLDLMIARYLYENFGAEAK